MKMFKSLIFTLIIMMVMVGNIKTKRVKRAMTWDNELSKVMLDAHNHYRGLLNSGLKSKNGDFPLPNPPIPALQWDQDIANFSKDRVSKCEYRFSFVSGYGENINYTSDRTKSISECKFDTEANMTEVVRKWFDEHNLFPTNEITKRMSSFTNSNFKDQFHEDRGTSHFTQIVWSRTIKVGCAADACYELNNCIYLVSCNYSPPGNQYKQPVYEF